MTIVWFLVWILSGHPNFTLQDSWTITLIATVILDAIWLITHSTHDA